jgi:hypothetical protein
VLAAWWLGTKIMFQAVGLLKLRAAAGQPGHNKQLTASTFVNMVLKVPRLSAWSQQTADGLY